MSSIIVLVVAEEVVAVTEIVGTLSSQDGNANAKEDFD